MLTLDSVALSYETNILDLVQLMLNNWQIQYTRIDGKPLSPKRNAAPRVFKHNNLICSMLNSITCGGAG